MADQQHWETVYQTRAADAVSWYSAHLDTSLALIEQAMPARDAAIIDMGGGGSTLVDDLLARGYRDLSVLDISASALAIARKRLGEAASAVTWHVADALDASLEAARYDLWHDRAVFHFLTDAAQRARYVRQLTHTLKPDGQLVLATFAPDGPQKCSGLDTVRYDARTLAQELGEGFDLIGSTREPHTTPGGSVQQFLYTHFRRLSANE